MLLAAAERALAGGGIETVTVRGVASAANTTTRAVYSLFGSRLGLLTALTERGWRYLIDGVAAVPETGDPREDLVASGLAFRRFALDHDALYRLVFGSLSVGSPSEIDDRRRDPAVQSVANEGRQIIYRRLDRLRATGTQRSTTNEEVFVPFNALCEGLATMELRGNFASRFATGEPTAEMLWRMSLGALLDGLV